MNGTIHTAWDTPSPWSMNQGSSGHLEMGPSPESLSEPASRIIPQQTETRLRACTFLTPLKEAERLERVHADRHQVRKVQAPTCFASAGFPLPRNEGGPCPRGYLGGC